MGEGDPEKQEMLRVLAHMVEQYMQGPEVTVRNHLLFMVGFDAFDLLAKYGLLTYLTDDFEIARWTEAGRALLDAPRPQDFTSQT